MRVRSVLSSTSNQLKVVQEWILNAVYPAPRRRSIPRIEHRNGEGPVEVKFKARDNAG
jgi:hypothetical protein